MVSDAGGEVILDPPQLRYTDGERSCLCQVQAGLRSRGWEGYASSLDVLTIIVNRDQPIDRTDLNLLSPFPAAIGGGSDHTLILDCPVSPGAEVVLEQLLTRDGDLPTREMMQIVQIRKRVTMSSNRSATARFEQTYLSLPNSRSQSLSVMIPDRRSRADPMTTASATSSSLPSELIQRYHNHPVVVTTWIHATLRLTYTRRIDLAGHRLPLSGRPISSIRPRMGRKSSSIRRCPRDHGILDPPSIGRPDLHPAERRGNQPEHRRRSRPDQSVEH